MKFSSTFKDFLWLIVAAVIFLTVWMAGMHFYQEPAPVEDSISAQ